MPARRFLPRGKEAAAETKASHEVMDLVRENPELSLMVNYTKRAAPGLL